MLLTVLGERMLKIEGRKMIKGRAEKQMTNSGGSNSSTIGMKIMCKFQMCVCEGQSEDAV